MTIVCYVVVSNFVMVQKGIFVGKVKSEFISVERAANIYASFYF